MSSPNEQSADLQRFYKKPEEYELAGKPDGPARVNAEEIVTGRAVYVADIHLPGMLVGKLKRSPYARARIVNVNTAAALALPGVACVITGRDFPPGCRIGCGVDLQDMADKSPLCTEEVCMWGDEVAAVAAVDEDTALRALDLIGVEYEALPPLLEPDQAMDPLAAPIHYADTRNISARTTMHAGNGAKAFSRAACSLKAVYRTQMVVHGAMENHGAVASFEDGRYTLWTSTQNPGLCRFWVARGLEVEEGQVSVVRPAVGGSFGGKQDIYPHELCACRLAERTGKPVKMILDREEVFFATRVRHPMEIEMETAFARDGRLLAKRCTHTLDGGAYGGSGLAAGALSLIWENLPYRTPVIDMLAQRPYTDKPAGGAMRGFTASQVHFAQEIHMDEAALLLGMDPLTLRRINGCTAGYETPTGLKIRACAFDEALTRVSQAVGWEEHANGSGLGPCQGIGISGSSFVSGSGLTGPRTASNSTMVRLNREGCATVFAGANDIGQGSDTMITMIVAEELGLAMKDVKCVVTDTTLTGYDAGSLGSPVTFLAGNSARRAAADAKRQLAAALAGRWGCESDGISMRGRRVFLREDPDQTHNLSYKEAVALCEDMGGGQCIVGIGSCAPEGPGPGEGVRWDGRADAYSFSAGACRVQVDCETGLVEIPDFYFAIDCGLPLNRRACEGQIEGAVQMGLGFACFEECRFDQSGRMVNARFRDYRFPTALDMPRVTSIFCGQPDPEGPFGAKEMGEGAVAPVAPAIVTGISRACNIRLRELPVTPENLWRKLRAQKG